MNRRDRLGLLMRAFWDVGNVSNGTHYVFIRFRFDYIVTLGLCLVLSTYQQTYNGDGGVLIRAYSCISRIRLCQYA